MPAWPAYTAAAWALVFAAIHAAWALNCASTWRYHRQRRLGLSLTMH
jgi:hypothetical protein